LLKNTHKTPGVIRAQAMPIHCDRLILFLETLCDVINQKHANQKVFSSDLQLVRVLHLSGRINNGMGQPAFTGLGVTQL
jgi:hypothetical protein